MALKAIDDTVLEVEDFRELDESVLAAMGEKELSAHASLAYRADASTRYMDLVYSHVKDAAVEEKVMCYTDVGFEVSGGGGSKLHALSQKISHVATCLANGGSKTKETQRELTEEEKTSGYTTSGVLQKSPVNGENLRLLTGRERAEGKLLVHKNYCATELVAQQKLLEELKAQREVLKQDIATERHEKVITGIDEIKELIMHPLKGLELDERGVKRKYKDLEALVLSRRKQEDILLKQLRDEELQEAKQKVQAAKQECDEKMAQIRADAEKAKEDAKAAKALADKAKSEERTAKFKADANIAKQKEAEAKQKHAEAKATSDKAKSDAAALKVAGKKNKKGKADAKSDES